MCYVAAFTETGKEFTNNVEIKYQTGQIKINKYALEFTLFLLIHNYLDFWNWVTKRFQQTHGKQRNNINTSQNIKKM